MKHLKLFSALLAIWMMLAMIPAMAQEGATGEPASVLPAKILTEGTYATKTIVSFDEEEIEGRISPASTGRCTTEIVDGVGISGKGLKMTVGSNTCESYVNIKEMDMSLYDGILYYVDISGVTLNDGKTTTGTGVRLQSPYAQGMSWTRNTVEPIVEGHKIDVYYLVGDEWKLCDESLMNGERSQYPEGFKGWVYAPFTSYTSTKGADGKPVAGVYGITAISKLMLLSGPYNCQTEVPGVIIFDEIQLVKLGKTNEEMAELEKENQGGDEDGDKDNDNENENNNPGGENNNKPGDSKNEKPGDSGTKVTEAQKTTEETKATEEKKGCGSSIALSSAVVLVGSTVACTAIVKKKKKKEE